MEAEAPSNRQGLGRRAMIAALGLAGRLARANANRAQRGRAPLPPITPHSLRRTWVTFCAMIGREFDREVDRLLADDQGDE